MSSPVSCSFCGKLQNAVNKIVAGPAARICDECIGLCSDIVDDGRFIVVRHLEKDFELLINKGGGYVFTSEQVEQLPPKKLMGCSIWRCKLEEHR